VKVQVSPGLASPSSPSEQSIFPLSGAVSGGHVTKHKLEYLHAVAVKWLYYQVKNITLCTILILILAWQI